MVRYSCRWGITADFLAIRDSAECACVRNGSDGGANPVNFPNNLARHAGIKRNGVRRQREEGWYESASGEERRLLLSLPTNIVPLGV